MKEIRTFWLDVLVAASLAIVAGCSNSTEPTPTAKYYSVDATTGYTSIDTAAFRTRLLGYGALSSADAPELVVCQEYAEAVEEMWSEVLSAPQLGSTATPYFTQGADEVISVNNALLTALKVFNLKEALPESSSGNFADPATDTVWDKAIGADNKLSDKKEALEAVYKVASFSVKQLKERRASATKDASRFVIDAQLAATRNHLMGVMQIFSAEQIMLPQTEDLSQEEVEEIRSRSITREWYTPP